MGNGGICPHFLDVGTEWNCMELLAKRGGGVRREKTVLLREAFKCRGTASQNKQDRGGASSKCLLHRGSEL